MRTLVFLTMLVLAGCASSDPVAEQISKEPPVEYALRGEVISVDTQIGTAKIKHEAIGDWMGAMTMDFPVKDQAQLAALKPGEQVEGKVFVQGIDFWAADLKEVAAPSPAAEKPQDEKPR